MQQLLRPSRNALTGSWSLQRGAEADGAALSRTYELGARP